jgi:hypothetical protein
VLEAVLPGRNIEISHLFDTTAGFHLQRGASIPGDVDPKFSPA